MKIALASFLIQQFQPIDAYTYGLYSQEPDCIVMREEIRMEMTVRLIITYYCEFIKKPKISGQVSNSNFSASKTNF